MSQAVGFEVLRSIRRIIRRVSLYSKDLARESGLTVPQLVCLKAVAELPDEVTVRAVSDRVSLSPPTVSRILERLVQGGLVTRTRSEIDRRRVHLELTEFGRERFMRLPTPLDEDFLERLDALPEEEREGLLAALQKIVVLMHAKDLDASPLLVGGEDVDD